MPDPVVFLSHSTADRKIVDAIREALQRNGIPCWIAPENIMQGEPWPQAISRGINTCKVMLCVLSGTANQSEDVEREISLACSKRKVVIPMRIEDVKPSEKLEYFLGNVQWFDAIDPPIDRHLWNITERINAAIKTADAQEAQRAESSGQRPAWGNDAGSGSYASASGQNAPPTYQNGPPQGAPPAYAPPAYPPQQYAQQPYPPAAYANPGYAPPAYQPPAYQPPPQQPQAPQATYTPSDSSAGMPAAWPAGYPPPPPSAFQQPVEVAATVIPLPKTAKPQRIALLYKRNCQPDDHVLDVLENSLKAAGHNVFIDRHLLPGVEWAMEIARQVRESDAVIPVLSKSSMQSDMVQWEVQTAHTASQQQFGKPRILPVLVGPEEPLPEPFNTVVGRIQYAKWQTPADDEALLTNMVAGLEAKEQVQSEKTSGGQTPGGAVPLDSRYYIVQETDTEFHEGLARQDGLLLVKGSRQMGKTSLLARGLKQARDAGKTVVLLDLQNLNQNDLKDLTSLYKALGGMIADKLDLDVYPDDKWRENRSPNANFENYIVREVMRKIEGHIVIAMDEVDRLFFFPFSSEIFGMFRSWFNARTTDPTMPWDRLTQAFVYATEPILFITDQFQSPFNVGTKIEMKDFDMEQLAKLNELYGKPIASDGELKLFYDLFAGQPYLSRRGLDELCKRSITVQELTENADMDEGPFGDHLRRMLVMIASDPKTLEVVTGMVAGQPIPDQMTFYNLRSGGLISGHSPEDAHFRCGVYKTYLARHLANHGH